VHQVYTPSQVTKRPEVVQVEVPVQLWGGPPSGMQFVVALQLVRYVGFGAPRLRKSSPSSITFPFGELDLSALTAVASAAKTTVGPITQAKRMKISSSLFRAVIRPPSC